MGSPVPPRVARAVAVQSVLGACALVACAVAGSAWPAPFSWPTIVLAVVLAGSLFGVLRYAAGPLEESRGERFVLGFEESVLFLALVGLPAAWAPLVVAVGTFADQVAARRVPVKAAFNTATGTLGAAASAVVFVALGAGLGWPAWAAALVAVLAYAAVFELSLQRVMTLLEGRRWWSGFNAEAARIVGLAACVSGVLGLAVFALWSLSPVLVLLVAPFMWFVRRDVRLANRARRESRTHDHVAALQRELVGVTDEASVAQRFLELCLSSFSAGRVELELPARAGQDPASPRVWSLGDGGPLHARLPWLSRGVGAGGELRIAPAASATGPFDGTDAALLGMLAAYAALAFENADALARLASLNETLDARVRERTLALEATNAELDSFVYSVSHDLRAPLRALDGFAHALVEDAGSSLNDEGRRDVDRILAAAARMDGLILALLQLSRASTEAKRDDEVDLSALARDILAEHHAREPARVVESAVQPGLVVRGDARLLRAALQNLLDNAWKFSSRKRVAHVSFGAEDTAEGRAFFVRDDGAGFDPAFSAKLFGAFQRLHSASEFPGTGVGLATVRRIVARHGGRTWATGRPGDGATFYFTLGSPVRVAAGEAGAPATPSLSLASRRSASP